MNEPKLLRPIRHITFENPEDTPHPIRYSPARDLAYLHPALIQKSIHFAITSKNSDFVFLRDEIGQVSNGKPGNMQDAARCVLRFLELAHDYPSETNPGTQEPREALEKSGWFQATTPAPRLAILAAIGCMTLMESWVARREIDDGLRSGVHLSLRQHAEMLDRLADGLEPGAAPSRSWWQKLKHLLGLAP